MYIKACRSLSVKLGTNNFNKHDFNYGDCIAIALLELKGFKSSHFKNLHPGSNLGKDLKYVSELMHTKNEIPIAKQDKKCKALITMTKKVLVV